VLFCVSSVVHVVMLFVGCEQSAAV